MVSAHRMAGARSLLFVPGNRAERFAKAHATEPGLVVIDLEDAVPVEEKDQARAAVGEYLAGGPGCAVRINPPGTAWHAADLQLVSRHEVAVMVPKAQDVDELRAITSALPPGPRVIALIETAEGVLTAPRIAAITGVGRLAFGNVDLAGQLGVDPADQLALAPHRSALVLASAAAAIAAPIDGVSAAINDPPRLKADTDHAARLGFSGKLCIHPRQVAAVEAAFRPSAEDVQWANAVVDAAAGGGVVVVGGQMVDKPVVDRARRILRGSGEGQQG